MSHFPMEKFRYRSPSREATAPITLRNSERKAPFEKNATLFTTFRRQASVTLIFILSMIARQFEDEKTQKRRKRGIEHAKPSQALSSSLSHIVRSLSTIWATKEKSGRYAAHSKATRRPRPRQLTAEWSLRNAKGAERGCRMKGGRKNGGGSKMMPGSGRAPQTDVCNESAERGLGGSATYG